MVFPTMARASFQVWGTYALTLLTLATYQDKFNLLFKKKKKKKQKDPQSIFRLSSKVRLEDTSIIIAAAADAETGRRACP